MDFNNVRLIILTVVLEMIHEEKSTKLLEKSKQLSCKFYKNGNCKFGTKCKFDHSKEQIGDYSKKQILSQTQVQILIS
jgi:hypothetical protein